LLASAVAALFVIATSGIAEAKCVESGIGTYRKGGVNRGTYEGSPGDICNTIIGASSDPIVSTAGGNSTMIGQLDLLSDGWRYTFANTPPGVVESFRVTVAHQSGNLTSFDVKVTRK
jgi:hypothetical protein